MNGFIGGVEEKCMGLRYRRGQYTCHYVLLQDAVNVMLSNFIGQFQSDAPEAEFARSHLSPWVTPRMCKRGRRPKQSLKVLGWVGSSLGCERLLPAAGGHRSKLSITTSSDTFDTFDTHNKTSAMEVSMIPTAPCKPKVPRRRH
jgi:hypothetical protein